jgi:hypothetical protein
MVVSSIFKSFHGSSSSGGVAQIFSVVACVKVGDGVGGGSLMGGGPQSLPCLD